MHNEKDNNSKGTANTTTKLSPIAIVLIVIAVIALFSVIIAGAVSSNNKKSGDNTVGMTLTEKNLKPQNNSSNNSVADRSLTKVEILMDDTAVVVGTTFKAAAVVEPENTDKALVWSSSNEDIMKVDSDGVVTVNNVGVAALTATVGDVSDAVAIEGIKSVSAGSANGYVVYTGNGSITGSNSSNSSSSGTSNSGTSGRTGYSYNSEAGSYDDGNSSGIDNGSSDGGYIADDSSNNSDGSYNNNSGNTSNNSGSNSSNTNSTNTGSSSSSTGNSDGMKSTDLPDILGNQGFTREYSNVYIYTENDTYYGEIIIQPEVSIIYIKQRSGGFDSKINSVLSELLPSEYSQVWSTPWGSTRNWPPRLGPGRWCPSRALPTRWSARPSSSRPRAGCWGPARRCSSSPGRSSYTVRWRRCSTAASTGCCSKSPPAKDTHKEARKLHFHTKIQYTTKNR